MFEIPQQNQSNEGVNTEYVMRQIDSAEKMNQSNKEKIQDLERIMAMIRKKKTLQKHIGQILRILRYEFRKFVNQLQKTTRQLVDIKNHCSKLSHHPIQSELTPDFVRDAD